MKHALGRILLLRIIFISLQANDFEYAMHVDKTAPYVKEAVLLTVDVNQTNHKIVLLFDFDLMESDSYTFQRIGIQEPDAYHNAQIRYTYLIYPLKPGLVNIHFHLIQKATTDESVAYSFSGDRDNVKGLVTTNTRINLAPLTLDVKPLPVNTQIVGDFSLSYKIKTLEAKAYEPLPLQVTITGLGYPPLLETLLMQDNSFTYFSDTPMVTSRASEKGTYNTVVYPMALSHDKSFTLHTIEIQAFDPHLQKSYTLTVPQQQFTITPVDKNILIDKVDIPKPFTVDWSWVQVLFSYLLVFIAGYLSALSWRWNKKKKHQSTNPLILKIENAKTTKALLQVLISLERKDFTFCIERLEASIYRNANINLKQIKKEAREKIV